MLLQNRPERNALHGVFGGDDPDAALQGAPAECALNRADVMKGLEQRTKKIQEAYTCKVLASESKFKAALERWTMTTSKRNALSIQKRKARKVAADAVVRAKKAKVGDPAAYPMEPPCATSPAVSATPACLSTPVPSIVRGQPGAGSRSEKDPPMSAQGRTESVMQPALAALQSYGSSRWDQGSSRGNALQPRP